MTPAEFQYASIAVLGHGKGWQTSIARVLAIDPRTIRRWMASEQPIPQWAEIGLQLAKERKASDKQFDKALWG